MIKSQGYRVSPDEVVDALYSSGHVAEAVVVAEPDEERGASIVAYLVLSESGDIQRLSAYCSRELPRYMQPTRYEIRDSLPRTSSGKFDALAVALPHSGVVT